MADNPYAAFVNPGVKPDQPVAEATPEANPYQQFVNPSVTPTDPNAPPQAPQMQGAAREFALPASAAAKGLSIAAGLPGDLQALYTRYIGGPLNKLSGRQPMPQLFPTSNDMVKATQGLRMVDRPDLVPQGAREETEAAAAQGVGQALPFAMTGGVGAAAPMLLGGAGQGIGSHYGEKVGASLGYPKTGAFVGGLAGGVGAQSLGGLGIRGVNQATGNLGPKAQAYQDAGVPLNFTDNTKAAAYSSQSLGGAGRTQALARQESDVFGKSVNDTASSLGQASSLQELGDNAQQAATQWIGAFKQMSSAAHEKVSGMVGASAPVTPSATKTVLADITSSGGGNPAAESFLKSGIAKDMESVIAGAPNGVIPWQTARALRSRIGEYLENPQLIADAGTSQAKRLYGALTDDLRATAAQSSNPNAPKLFDLSNSFTKQGHAFIEDTLAPILNKSSPEAASWIVNSAKNGDQVVGPLRSEIPKLADDVASFKLRDMALAPNGKQNASGTTVSPGSFLTDWNALSPEAKSALYSNPAVAKKIEALASIADDVKSRQALMNHSNTAHHGALTMMGLAAMEGGAKGYESGGLTGAAIGGAIGGAGIPAGNYAYSLLGANRPLARLMAAKGPPMPTATGGLLAGANTAAQLQSRQGLLDPRQ